LVENRPDLIEATQSFWERRTGRVVTPDNAREIIENISGYFRVLLEWKKKSNSEKVIHEK